MNLQIDKATRDRRDERSDLESGAARAERDPSRQRRPDPPQRTDEQALAPGWAARLRAHPIVVSAAVFVLIAIVVGTTIWWLNARHFESTDDAFIDARTAVISAQVAGAIVDVDVTDNQVVQAGATLVRLDDRDYRTALEQAKAQVEQAQASVANLDAQIDEQQPRIDEAESQVTQAQGALTFSQQENTRYGELARKGSGSEQQAQQASSDLRQKQAGYKAAQAAATAAEKQLDVLKAQRQNALAQLDQARAAADQAATNLSRATVTAPAEGRVTKLTAAKGAYAEVGAALTMFVPREVWVTANFKETQLAAMRPGQPVDIVIDAYPDRIFQGRVDSIQAGSGTAFSLLPAENATGNFVKVVQRVPVKIVFDAPPDVLLGPGMSVVPSVRVR